MAFIINWSTPVFPWVPRLILVEHQVWWGGVMGTHMFVVVLTEFGVSWAPHLQLVSAVGTASWDWPLTHGVCTISATSCQNLIKLQDIQLGSESWLVLKTPLTFGVRIESENTTISSTLSYYHDNLSQLSTEHFYYFSLLFLLGGLNGQTISQPFRKPHGKLKSHFHQETTKCQWFQVHTCIISDGPWNKLL